MSDEDQPVGVDELLEVSLEDGGSDVDLAIAVMNLISGTVAPLRDSAGPMFDATLMTSLVTLAGAILGEGQEIGYARDMTEEATNKFLTVNFELGVQAGRKKAKRIRESMS